MVSLKWGSYPAARQVEEWLCNGLQSRVRLSPVGRAEVHGIAARFSFPMVVPRPAASRGSPDSMHFARPSRLPMHDR